jgi:hypothetical protein
MAQILLSAKKRPCYLCLAFLSLSFVALAATHWTGSGKKVSNPRLLFLLGGIAILGKKYIFAVLK